MPTRARPRSLASPLRRRAALAAAAALAAGTLAGYARPSAADSPAPRAAAADTAHAPLAPHAPHAPHAPLAARPDTLTAAARAQLAAARRATAALATPAAAVAAGYRPMFGHVPLQGEHYVRVDRVLADTFDVERPPVLMFAPVAGRPTLVGVAYAYLHPTGAAPPAGFDGAGPGVWHAHERLAPLPGRHLLMMHAWFVDAPAGPWARYNPWLPYLAAGLAPPAAATLADSAAGERARRLGLALASVESPPLLFRWVARQGGDSLRARLAPHEAAIAALVPRLVAAERAGDAGARARLADEAVRHGDALVAAYREAAPERPLVRRLVDRTVDEFLGRGHGIEEELGALFAGGAAPRDPAPRDSGRGATHQHAP
jgi:hypothetical protein